MPRTPRHDLEILALAHRQRGLVTTSQLRSAGLSAGAIMHRVGTARLHRVYRGVYAVGRPGLDRSGRWLAAVLACGDEAMLSHVPAALLEGILERGDERPHVSVPTHAGRRPPAGILVHRSVLLTPEDRAIRDGIPVTRPARTVFDLAGALDLRALKAAVRRAVRLELVTLEDLAGMAVSRHDFRAVRLRRVLGAYVPGEETTESELEARFLELCDRHGLPGPQRQVRIGGHRADFAWPDHRLVVETDGFATHGTPIALLDDRVKDRAMRAAGYDVLRFTWAEVVNAPAAVAEEVRRALARRAPARAAGDPRSG